MSEAVVEDGGQGGAINAVLNGQSGNQGISHALGEGQQGDVQTRLEVSSKRFSSILAQDVQDGEGRNPPWNFLSQECVCFFFFHSNKVGGLYARNFSRVLSLVVCRPYSKTFRRMNKKRSFI